MQRTYLAAVSTTGMVASSCCQLLHRADEQRKVTQNPDRVTCNSKVGIIMVNSGADFPLKWNLHFEQNPH